MTLADRIGRASFVALAVGLAWGIRGDFGHVIGAMYPGAVLGLAFAFVSGQRSCFLWMPILSALASYSIGAGGTMSYGILHGYAQADSLRNYSYGFLTLFLQGSAWGTFGGALIGLMLEKRPMRTGDWLGLLGSVYVGAWLFSLVVVNLLGFDINPPRNNSSIAFFGAALGQLLWLATHHRPTGFRGGLLGYLGFGLGMAGGRLLANLANVLQEPTQLTINHWNVMEVTVGLVGGFIFTFGMVPHAYPEPDEDEFLRLPSFLGILSVLAFIPLWHRIERIQPDVKLADWSQKLASFGHADPDRLALITLRAIDALCILGFLGAGVWWLIHARKAQRWSWLPVFWLSSSMLLLQNLNALYFLDPADPKRLNMHTLFWILLALMAAYALIARPRLAPPAEERAATFRASSWILGATAGLAVIIAAASLINGETTMRSANTRWPLWSWSQGPFPGSPDPAAPAPRRE